jgi:hypothetical protein
MEITPGQRLTVLDALGKLREKRVIALTNGSAFDACDEAEWVAAGREGRDPDPDPFPWPLEGVQADET